MTKYNYNELAHLSISCAIWIRHLHEAMPMYEPITQEMVIKSKVLGSGEIHRIYPYYYLIDNFDNWFENLSPRWNELANRDKPKKEMVYSKGFVKVCCINYACANFDNIFDVWFDKNEQYLINDYVIKRYINENL